MSKFIGFIIGAAEIAVGVATGNVELIVMGGATILAQAAADLTAPTTPARDASEMGIKLGEQPRCLRLGERETAGTLVDASDWGGKYDDDWEGLAIRLADHECEGLTGYYVNDDYNVYTGDGLVSRYDDQFKIFFRSNTSTQPLPAEVLAYWPGWTAADIGRSGCDVFVFYKADKENDKHPGWPNGRPRFLFILKGKRCYDPRKDSTVPGGSGPHRWDDPSTWEFTENCVICRYNWVRGIFSDDDVSDPSKLLIGRGLTAEEAPPENIFAAANLCDFGAAGIKPAQQVATTIGGLAGLSFGGAYCAHWDYAGGQIEWFDVRTRSRLGASPSPGTMTGLLSSVSVASSGTAYCLAPKLPSGNLFYIVTEPLRSPVSTLVIGAASAQVDVIRALDTIDGLRVYGAYHAAAGYLVGAGHAGMAGSARDFCVDDALHPWMASQPTGASSSFTLTDLKTGATTTFIGAVGRSGPSDLRVAYCAAGGNFLVNTDGHFYIIDKATMTVTSTGVPAFGYDRPDTQQDPSRTSFWDGMSEYSLETGALVRALNPLDWIASIDSGFTFDVINDAVWSLDGLLVNIRFLDRSGPWRVAGPIYADQECLEVEQMFAEACAGNIVTREGSVELEPAQAKSISFSFTDADLVVGEEATWNNGILSDADGERVNTVVPSYTEPDQKWNDHAAPVLRDPADIIADGKPLEAFVPLRLVRYLAQALRIGEILRRKGRVWGRGSVVLGPRFCEVEEGDWGEWQSDRFFGGATKTVQVDAYALDEKFRNRLTLRETNASIFADDAVYPLDSSIPTTTPPPPPIGAPAGGTWTLNSTTLTSAGASVPALTVTGASDDQYAQAIKVEQWKSDGVTDPYADPDAIPWTTVGSYGPDATEIQLPAPTGGETYYAAVSYIVSGQQGDRLVLGPVTAGDFAALITVEDEGSPLTLSPSSINFTGAGVTATVVGDDVTVDVPGGGSGGDWWFSPPDPAGFSLLSGDATNPTFTTDADIGSVLKFNSASVAGDIVRAAVEPITTPAAAWTYEARMAGNLFNTNFAGAGLMVRNVANNRNVILMVQNDGSIVIQRRTMSAFGASVTTIFAGGFPGWEAFAATFWKVSYDLTNVLFWSSAGGKYWRRVWTEPVATYLVAAPDEIGFGIYTNDAGITDDIELSVQRRTKSW